MAGAESVVHLASVISSELAEYRRRRKAESDTATAAGAPIADAGGSQLEELIDPDELLLADYDRRITDDALRLATRGRFASKHYADAVEAAAKALNECVRAKAGSHLDGDTLMTTAFSPNSPLLRLNRLRSDSDKSEQRGHMMMCQGVVAAWRNPRAHSTQIEDEPERAIAMIEHVQHLMEKTRSAIKTRKKKP